MRLSYATEDLQKQGWFDPFKKSRNMLSLPNEEEYRAVWEELDELEKDPLRDLIMVPKEQWRRDQLNEPFEQGWHGWDEKNRWTLHYQATLGKMLSQHPGFGHRYQRFLSLAEHLNSAALQIVREFALALDESQRRSELAEALWTDGIALTRFLHYKPGAAEFAARAHRDRSGITVHWWESSPGLVFYRSKYQWISAPSGISPICFAGRKLWMTTRGQFPALIHGIRDERLPLEQAIHHRRSIVSFVHWEPLAEKALKHYEMHPERGRSFPW